MSLTLILYRIYVGLKKLMRIENQNTLESGMIKLYVREKNIIERLILPTLILYSQKGEINDIWWPELHIVSSQDEIKGY